MFRRLSKLTKASAAPLARAASGRHLFGTTTAHSHAHGALLTEVKNNVLHVTFNKPAAFNAMDVSMGKAFHKLMIDLEQSVSENPDAADGVKAVVFSGAGKAFSAGGDLAYLLDRAEDNARHNMTMMTTFYSYFLSVRKCPVPTIAAINGPAVGAGACFALACDLRVIAADAYIGYTFSKLGLHPGMGATHFLPQLVGPQTAARLLLTGEMVQAADAKTLGLVTEVAPAGELSSRVDALAQSLAGNHSIAQFTLLRTLRAQQDEGLDKALLREADSQAHSYRDPLFKANVEAVKNKTNKNKK